MKQKFKNTQRGITLVALVITIIVLLILAMVSIRIVMDGGLISKAKDATAQHTIGAEKEAITTGYAAYQIDSIKTKSPDLLIEGAKATPKGEDWIVKFTKTNNEYELKKDGTITLTKQGNGSATTVGWTDNGDDTFTKENITVKLGDIVYYNEGTGYSTTVTTSDSGYGDAQEFTTEDLGWRVLGINTNGELELISDNPTTYELYLKEETGYLNAENVLNNMCNELFGKGIYSTGARSLNVEDINKLANYDPKTYEGYGNIWTYRLLTSGNLQYKTTKADGTLVKDWTNIVRHQKFRIPGETEEISTNDTGRSLEYTDYNYTIADKVKQTTSDGKNMSDVILNGTGSSCVNQWLSSRSIVCHTGGVTFYIRAISGTEIGSTFVWYSWGETRYDMYGNYRVRPVVSLESDIQLSGNSNDGWTIN